MQQNNSRKKQAQHTCGLGASGEIVEAVCCVYVYVKVVLQALEQSLPIRSDMLSHTGSAFYCAAWVLLCNHDNVFTRDGTICYCPGLIVSRYSSTSNSDSVDYYDFLFFLKQKQMMNDALCKLIVPKIMHITCQSVSQTFSSARCYIQQLFQVNCCF